MKAVQHQKGINYQILNDTLPSKVTCPANKAGHGNPGIYSFAIPIIPL